MQYERTYSPLQLDGIDLATAQIITLGYKKDILDETSNPSDSGYPFSSTRAQEKS